MNRGRKTWGMETLIRRALAVRGETARWGAIRELRQRGTREIFEKAKELCLSAITKHQMLGANILAQLGTPGRAFPEETTAILHSMLSEQSNAEVLWSALYALGHAQAEDDVSGLGQIASFRNHPDSTVRHAVVFALLGREQKVAIDTLILLSDDQDMETRDWAIFGLGAQIETDSPAIREALWRHVDDQYPMARWEAINGLAIRKDSRVRNILIKEISAKNPIAGWFQIAAESADASYLEALEKKLRAAEAGSDCDDEWLKELLRAIEAIRIANNLA